jgi:hypothetical protein
MRGILVGTAIMTTFSMRLLLEFMLPAPPYSLFPPQLAVDDYGIQGIKSLTKK